MAEENKNAWRVKFIACILHIRSCQLFFLLVNYDQA